MTNTARFAFLVIASTAFCAPASAVGLDLPFVTLPDVDLAVGGTSVRLSPEGEGAPVEIEPSSGSAIALPAQAPAPLVQPPVAQAPPAGATDDAANDETEEAATGEGAAPPDALRIQQAFVGFGIIAALFLAMLVAAIVAGRRAKNRPAAA